MGMGDSSIEEGLPTPPSSPPSRLTPLLAADAICHLAFQATHSTQSVTRVLFC